MFCNSHGCAEGGNDAKDASGFGANWTGEMNRQVSSSDEGSATDESELFSAPPSLLSRSQYVEQFQQMGGRRIPGRTEVGFLRFFLFSRLNSASASVASIIST